MDGAQLTLFYPSETEFCHWALRNFDGLNLEAGTHLLSWLLLFVTWALFLGLLSLTNDVSCI